MMITGWVGLTYVVMVLDKSVYQAGRTGGGKSGWLSGSFHVGRHNGRVGFRAVAIVESSPK